MILLIWLRGGNDWLAHWNIVCRIRLHHGQAGASLPCNVCDYPDGTPDACRIVDLRKFILAASFDQ